MLITFSGLDGAGKSTLIEWLTATLEEQHKRVAVFHMNDHIGLYAYLRAIRDRITGRPHVVPATPPLPGPDDQPSGAHGFKHAVRELRRMILWNKPLRRLIYPLDLLVFWVYRVYIEKVKKQILVMDRYFYDTLVDVSDGRHWGWVRLLERITPTPTLAIFLAIDPEESFARKGEYSVEYLRRRWEAYRKVFTWVPSALTLVNDDLGLTQARLRRVVLERLGGQRSDAPAATSPAGN